MAYSFPLNSKNNNITKINELKLIEKRFREIDRKYEDLKTFLQNLKAFGYSDENDTNNIMNDIKNVIDLMQKNWKLISDIDQEKDSLKFDMYLDSINDYKIHIIHLITGIRDVLKNSNGSSYCRDSTSTNESKTLFNTRRQTQAAQIDLERENDSITFRSNIFVNINIDLKPKVTKEGQIKTIENLLNNLEQEKYERKFNLMKFISDKIIITKLINTDHFEEKGVMKILVSFVVFLIIIFLIKKYS